MKVQFKVQEVSAECVRWLLTNVGPGNLYFTRTGLVEVRYPREADTWLFQIINGDTPTITVKDEKMAAWFALRWT